MSVACRETLAKLETAYKGIVWRDLSIDLVAASLRQRSFTTKIVRDCADINSPTLLSRATTRYKKFLFLMMDGESGHAKGVDFVPTLDIDLCWHTHQLFPRSYQEWCFKNLGQGVDHDDTIGETVATQGLRSISLAWFSKYGECYTMEDLRKAYFTSGRKWAGIMFPPYGLYTLHMGRKLTQAGSGNQTRSFCFLKRLTVVRDKEARRHNKAWTDVASCHKADCHKADCHKADCHKVAWTNVASCHKADCHKADCHKADCHKVGLFS